MIDVSCAIIESSKDILIAQRNDDMDLSNQWEFPGGKVESNEPPTLCIVREIQEELNLTIQVTSELTPNTHKYPNKTIRLIPFVCKIISGEIKLSEHKAFKWVKIDELPNFNWCEADIAILNEYLKLKAIND